MAFLGREPTKSPLVTSDIPDNSITAAKIVADTIAAGDIATGAVDTAELADDAVTGAKIENNPTIAGNLTVSGDLVPSTPLSNRNLIINGGMQVSQRGTSEATMGGTSNGYRKAPDRFRFATRETGIWTVSQSTESPEGFSYSYKYDNTTADASLDANSYLLLQTKFEGQNLQHLKYGTSNAETTTVSFYVRSAKTGTYILELEQTDDSRHIAQSYTISSADTWERKTLTFAGDTAEVLDNDANGSLTLKWWLAAGTDYSSGTLATSWASYTNANAAVGQLNLGDSTSNDFHITGIQWEVGSNATPFEHRSFGDELARCERYYQKSWEYGTAVGTVTTTSAPMRYVDATQSYAGVTVWHRCEMRTTPTIVSQSTTSTTTAKINSDSAEHTAGYSFGGPKSVFIHASNSSIATSNGVRFHYTATAEL